MEVSLPFPPSSTSPICSELIVCLFIFIYLFFSTSGSFLQRVSPLHHRQHHHHHHRRRRCSSLEHSKVVRFVNSSFKLKIGGGREGGRGNKKYIHTFIYLYFDGIDFQNLSRLGKGICAGGRGVGQEHVRHAQLSNRSQLYS